MFAHVAQAGRRSIRSPDGMVIEICMRGTLVLESADGIANVASAKKERTARTLTLELWGIASCPFFEALTTTSQTPKSFFVIG